MPICPDHRADGGQNSGISERTKLQVLAPIVSGRKGAHVKVLEQIRKQGYVRVRIDGEMAELSDDIELEKNKKHSIEVVIDRIVVKEGVAAGCQIH